MYICVIFGSHTFCESVSSIRVSIPNNTWINECLEQISIYYLAFSVGQEFSSSLQWGQAGLKSFEAQLRLEDPRWFLHLHRCWCWLLAGTLRFFPWGPFIGCLRVPHHASTPRMSMIAFMTRPWKSYAVISAVSCWLQGSALFIIGGSYTGA